MDRFDFTGNAGITHSGTTFYFGTGATNDASGAINVKTVTASGGFVLPGGQSVVSGQLARVAGVDCNTATATTLYTAPAGLTYGVIITAIKCYNASTSLTTASWSVGWNSTSFNNVVADATHTGMTGATIIVGLTLIATGITAGASSGVLKILMNTLQGGAATMNVIVEGIVI